MKEISLHILDIVQNSIHAGSSSIEINIRESKIDDCLSFVVSDNGSGMDKTEIEKILDPFYTSKNKKTGMGIPLLKQHAEMAGGKIEISSEKGQGTTILALFEYNNIDRQPLGDIKSTITGLIRTNPEIDFIFTLQIENNRFELDTQEIKKVLEGIKINTPEVIRFLDNKIDEFQNKNRIE
ncbi:MAG: ATP-binding protein [Bacteroidales bacterium]|nr:ATP-binding protein [Bacteroidales bacterium]MBN2819003.1 ATP-binding protein [Bacteroidales bacterium]